MKGKIVKSLIALCLVATMVMSSFAAVVSDDDSSAFVTKSEFEAIKNNYDNQIKGYLSSVDEKIDNTIANYLNNFAGGGVGGRLTMSEKTAIYKHTITVNKWNNVEFTTKPTFNLYTQRKQPFVKEDFVHGEVGNKPAFVCDTKGILKDGIALHEDGNLMFGDLLNVGWGSGINKIAGKEVDANCAISTYDTAAFLRVGIMSREDSLSADGKAKMLWQFDLRTSSGGYISGTDKRNWDHLDFTDTVAVHKINPVDMGANFAASGEMISKAQMNMGLNQATYKHSLVISSVKGVPVTGNTPFVFYSTSPEPLTAEILTSPELCKQAQFSNHAMIAYYPPIATGGFALADTTLVYGTDAINAKAWKPTTALTGTATVSGVLYKNIGFNWNKRDDWPWWGLGTTAVWDNGSGSAATHQLHLGAHNCVVTDTVTLASTNPLDYGSKHLVTGELFAIQDVSDEFQRHSAFTAHTVLLISNRFLLITLKGTTATFPGDTDLLACKTTNKYIAKYTMDLPTIPATINSTFTHSYILGLTAGQDVRIKSGGATTQSNKLNYAGYQVLVPIIPIQ